MNIINFFKTLTKNFYIGILLFFIGITIIISPEFCKKAIILILGIGAIVNGLYSIIVTRKLVADSFFQYTMIFKGMLGLVVGLLAVFLIIYSENVVVAMMIMLAIYLFITTIIQMISSGKIKEDEKSKKNLIFEAVISTIIAVVLVIIIANVIIYIAGGIMIILGIGLVVYELKNRPIIAEKVEVVDDISGTIE